jgi:uncharacterized protein YbjT (DUF2867 family)
VTGTVLVIGGTGMLGTAVTNQLRNDGYRVRLLVRSVPGGSTSDREIEYVEGDLDDAATLARALDGCTSAHVSVRGGPTVEQFYRIEHRGTARLAELGAQAGLHRLTYISHSLASPDAPSADLRAKALAERAIASSGVPYTIFRPTYVMDTLRRHVRGDQAVILGTQPHQLHMIAAGDLARLISKCLAVPESAGLRLDAHGPRAVTLMDALRAYRDHLAPDVRVVSRPLWFMTILDRTVLRGQLRGTLGLMRAIQEQGERGDPRPTNKLLGAPATTLAEWLQAQAPPEGLTADQKKQRQPDHWKKQDQ